MAPAPAPFEDEVGRRKPCPICRKPSRADTAPFCSPRCADVDLGRWLGGVYAVPTDEPGQVAGAAGGGADED